MNEIVNKFLLTRDKFMSERHFRQPGFTYSAFGPLTINKEIIQKFKETGYSQTSIEANQIRLIFKMTWLMKILKDLTRRIASDEILHNKAFDITKSPKQDRYQRGL